LVRTAFRWFYFDEIIASKPLSDHGSLYYENYNTIRSLKFLVLLAWLGLRKSKPKEA
jgi:hypothetical protein